jgi:hypothetical protein
MVGVGACGGKPGANNVRSRTVVRAVGSALPELRSAPRHKELRETVGFFPQHQPQS